MEKMSSLKAWKMHLEKMEKVYQQMNSYQEEDLPYEEECYCTSCNIMSSIMKIMGKVVHGYENIDEFCKKEELTKEQSQLMKEIYS